MAISTQQCDAINEAVERNRVVMLVGQTQQYISHNLKGKSIVQSGELGKLVMIHDVRHGPYFHADRPSWFLDKAKSGGGIVFNLGAHAIDKIQWLTDSRITRVRASLSYHAERYPDMEGSAVMMLETSQGVTCTVNLSGYDGVDREETELVFTHGMIKIINHDSVWISEDGKYRQVPIEHAVNPFELQLTDLAACIREGRQPYSSGEYGRSVVRVIEAIYQSAQLDDEVTIEL